jgi:hypothetical protein
MFHYSIFEASVQARLPLQARPPAKPARLSPEAQPMADGQGEAAWGTSGQVAPLILYN